MDTAVHTPSTARYAKCIDASKRVRWEIDRDVIRGREFDLTRKFIPDQLARMDVFNLANPDERRFLSQIQGRTYANMFGLVERYIGAKMLEVCKGHALGDQVAFEALVRFTDEELKHQELFRRLETMMAGGDAAGLPLPAPAQRRRQRGARQVHLGGARAHLPHRALHARPLPPEHRQGPGRLRALEGRVPLPHARGVAARDPGRDGMAARGREAHAGAARPGAWAT